MSSRSAVAGDTVRGAMGAAAGVRLSRTSIYGSGAGAALPLLNMVCWLCGYSIGVAPIVAPVVDVVQLLQGVVNLARNSMAVLFLSCIGQKVGGLYF